MAPMRRCRPIQVDTMDYTLIALIGLIVLTVVASSRYHSRTWVDGPIWWQVGLGGAWLALAAFLARRVPSHAARSPVVQ